jgi:hypothetical protein
MALPLAKIGFQDARIARQLGARPFDGDLAHFQHVAVIANLQGGADILLDQQDRQPAAPLMVREIFRVLMELRRGRSPITAPISVVLPAPFGPTIATIFPAGTVRLTPCSTSTWP